HGRWRGAWNGWGVSSGNRTALLPLGTGNRGWRTGRNHQRPRIQRLGILRWIPAASRRPAGVFVASKSSRAALSYSAADRSNFRNPLSARRARLWLQHGLGPGIRNFPVVLWPAHGLPAHGP